ncbi:hypothetical protein PCH_Pc16g11090 [Penicillium rubens Wisconsin 54-1255]|uniref:Uncharacterized protein n=1 Tax=Penicillium rubens (strain ATCC 28089 / DSM 1075 / NRRL 1951 / Wisconsin 54-1255) TaxID=500485 RepID=B6H9L8_PENRW|nr:hypothetical protein PCH_Pc16g11090 [Penicillium rubens Wisconsin 54-1255]
MEGIVLNVEQDESMYLAADLRAWPKEAVIRLPIAAMSDTRVCNGTNDGPMQCPRIAGRHAVVMTLQMLDVVVYDRITNKMPVLWGGKWGCARGNLWSTSSTKLSYSPGGYDKMNLSIRDALVSKQRKVGNVEDDERWMEEGGIERACLALGFEVDYTSCMLRSAGVEARQYRVSKGGRLNLRLCAASPSSWSLHFYLHMLIHHLI